LQRGVNADISVVHNGIDCERFNPESEVVENKKVLYVGRLKHGKGVDLLIDAFANIARDESDTELVSVGDGPMESKLRAQVDSYDLQERVQFSGTVPNKQLPRVYNESSVLVLPSANEGFPRTVLEALACETPVIVSQLPQLEEIVSDSGYMVQRENTELLADRIHELLVNDELRNRFGENGRNTVLTNYSWKETVSETTDVLSDVLKHQ